MALRKGLPSVHTHQCGLRTPVSLPQRWQLGNLLHAHASLKMRQRQRGCCVPNVVNELWSLIQKTARPTSLFCMTLLKMDYYSPLNSLATVWPHSSRILFPWVATVTSRVNQWTKPRLGTHGKCYPYSNLVAQCDPGQGPRPQLCKGFSEEKSDRALQEGSRD